MKLVKTYQSGITLQMFYLYYYYILKSDYLILQKKVRKLVALKILSNTYSCLFTLIINALKY